MNKPFCLSRHCFKALTSVGAFLFIFEFIVFGFLELPLLKLKVQCDKFLLNGNDLSLKLRGSCAGGTSQQQQQVVILHGQTTDLSLQTSNSRTHIGQVGGVLTLVLHAGHSVGGRVVDALLAKLNLLGMFLDLLELLFKLAADLGGVTFKSSWHLLFGGCLAILPIATRRPFLGRICTFCTRSRETLIYQSQPSSLTQLRPL